jgi:hypothetical protein
MTIPKNHKSTSRNIANNSITLNPNPSNASALSCYNTNNITLTLNSVGTQILQAPPNLDHKSRVYNTNKASKWKIK